MPKAKQVLLVENREHMAAEFKDLFDQIGYKVTVIDDPEQAADTLAGRDYEIALMNMTLPGMNWRRTMMTVKNSAKTTTVISVKESPDEDDVRLALNAGSYIALTRPLTPERFNGLLSPQNDGLFVALRN